MSLKSKLNKIKYPAPDYHKMARSGDWEEWNGEINPTSLKKKKFKVDFLWVAGDNQNLSLVPIVLRKAIPLKRWLEIQEANWSSLELAVTYERDAVPWDNFSEKEIYSNLGGLRKLKTHFAGVKGMENSKLVKLIEIGERIEGLKKEKGIEI